MIEQLLEVWENKIKETTEIFELLGERRAMKPVAPGKNRLIYLLGHLLVIHDGIFETLEVGKRRYTHYDDLFLTPQHPANVYPPYGLLLQQWIALNETLIFQLRYISPDEWLSKQHYISEMDFILQPNKNKFYGFQCLTGHLFHHLGQLALIEID